MRTTEWHEQVTEAIIEPHLPICDPHHHLWDTTGASHHPAHRYLLDELLADTGSGHNVVATVFMECMAMYRCDGPKALRPVGETEFANGVAAMCASGMYGAIRACAAIVGFADLNLGAAVGPVLDAHAAASDRFRGIRHACAWDPSSAVKGSHTNPTERMLADKTFREGFAELGQRGMTFDAWLYHPQIPELTELARAFPEQPIIFDHFGGVLGIGPYAGQREAILRYWKKAVAELATCPNVYPKLGGLVMPVNGFGFHKADKPPTSEQLAAVTRDYYLHMIDLFGTDRCMFESNFPVDKRSCSYAVLWNSFKRIAEGCSAEEKAALFHDNAARIYSVCSGMGVP
ncbi:MAG: amidohydrolase family protein [Gammaproteobacteria bacterium]|nr:amidohydrolase family protein [Gammaproteobacteria bacterium]